MYGLFLPINSWLNKSPLPEGVVRGGAGGVGSSGRPTNLWRRRTVRRCLARGAHGLSLLLPLTTSGDLRPLEEQDVTSVPRRHDMCIPHQASPLPAASISPCGARHPDEIFWNVCCLVNKETHLLRVSSQTLEQMEQTRDHYLQNQTTEQIVFVC